MAEPQPLTAKQEAFVSEYLRNGRNATAAYKAAYDCTNMAPATINGSAWELLQHPQITGRIREVVTAVVAETKIDAARVLAELALVAFSDVGEVLDFSTAEPSLRPANEIPESARRAISSVKVRRYLEGKGEAARTVEVTEFKFWDKTAGLDKLGRHFAMFTDKIAPVSPDGKSAYDPGIGSLGTLVADLRAAVERFRRTGSGEVDPGTIVPDHA